MTEPVWVDEVLPEVVAEAIARAGPDYDRWMEQVAQTGYCTHPVRLRGQVEHADRSTGRSVVCIRLTGSRTPPSSRAAATAGCRSAPPVRPPTRPTASNSWPPASG